MKILTSPSTHTRLAAALSLGLCARLAPGASGAEATQPTFTEQQTLESWGWILADQQAVSHVQISDAEFPTFLRGLAAGLHGQPSPFDQTHIFPDVTKLAADRREPYLRGVKAQNQAAWENDLLALRKNPNFAPLPGGLWYEILKPGTGPCPQPQQTVTIHYTASFLDGTEFFQFGPIDEVVLSIPMKNFHVGEAVQKLGRGGVMKLYIPSPASDKDGAINGLPPGTAMVVDLELTDIKPTSPDDLENATLPPAPMLAPPGPAGYPKPQVMEEWGWSVVQGTPVQHLDLSDADFSWFTQGLVAGMKGQPAPVDLAAVEPVIEKFVHDRSERLKLAFKQKQFADTQACFAGLSRNPSVVKLPSGLCYEILKPGTGPCATLGKTVEFRYTGRLLNGKVFDKNDTQKIDISTHPLDWIIAGWIEGLQKINRGGTLRLYVPPSLGYDEEGAKGVPPGSTLIYDIEMLDIRDTPPQ